MWRRSAVVDVIFIITGSTLLTSALVAPASHQRLRTSARNALVSTSISPQDSRQPLDLLALLAAGKLRPRNRDVTKLNADRAGVHVSEGEGPGIVWVQDTDLATGTIEVEVRGRDVFQRSFIGIAFHGKDDNRYEAVYLRPFNFRTDDAARRQHAVQCIAAPDYDWLRLRREFPEEFESPVDPSVSPADWIPLHVVVRERSVEVYIGGSRSPTLKARKLGQLTHGMIGLWVGNNSDGDFANLHITGSK